MFPLHSAIQIVINMICNVKGFEQQLPQKSLNKNQMIGFRLA